MKILKNAWLPSWAWTLIFRHLQGAHNRPAIKWMNRFALLGICVGTFAWTTVTSTMRGLQNDRRNRVLVQKPHLLWDGAPRSDILAKREVLEKFFGDSLSSLKFVLQTEGLFEIANSNQKGRSSGAGVVIQGVEDPESGIQFGIELMSEFHLAPGSLFKLHNVWRMDLPPLELEVDQSFESGIYEIDRSTLRVPRVLLENWLGMKDAISRIEIQLKDPHRADELIENLKKETGLVFNSWKTLDASLWYSLKLEMIVITIAVFFVVLIAAFSVHMALSVRVVEKSREVALLRGLGANDKILARLYFTEALLLGIFASIVGLLLAYVFCMGLSKWWKLPAIYYYTNLPIDWNWGMSLALTSISIGLTGIAGYLPARRVRSIEIQEALRS